MVHGDAHTDNFMINYLGENQFDMTVIDFDYAQKSWFIVDIGTVIWYVNMSLWV